MYKKLKSKKPYLTILAIIIVLCMVSCKGTEKEKSSLDGGLYPMYENEAGVRNYGFIDETGEYIIAPQFLYAEYFNEGLALVKDADTGLFGYIDSSGKWVIAPEFYSARSFSNGYATVNDGWDWGYIDHTGEYILEPEFIWTSSFNKEGKAAVGSGIDSALIIDTKGNVYEEVKGNPDEMYEPYYQFNIKFDAIKRVWDFSEGPIVKINKNGTVGYIDNENNYVINPNRKLDMRCEFSEGRMPVFEDYEDAGIRGYKYGYIDEKGELKTEKKYFMESFSYLYSIYFKGGVALVRTISDKDGKVEYGYINKDGDWLIKKNYYVD